MSNIAHKDLLQQITERFGPPETDYLDTLNSHWFSDNKKYRLTCTYTTCFLYVKDGDSNSFEDIGQPMVHITNLGMLPYDFKVTKKVTRGKSNPA